MSGEAKLHVLFEHATGFAVFKIREFEEESIFQSEVEECVTEYSRFAAVASLVAFSPFKTAHAALENLNAITEGILPEDLKNFIIQVGTKKITLGVIEAKLGSAIAETFPKLKLKLGGLIQELTRGIRLHFYKLVKVVTPEAGEWNYLFGGSII